MGEVYGYIRVSSIDQNEERQRIAMARHGIAGEHLFIDKQSGKDFQRPQYKAIIKRLKKGDLLCITSIDRLGRNYEEILQEWRRITRKIQADIFVFDMPLLDTRQGKDLIGTLISDIVLQLLSFVAQKERENIRTRQAEGIAAARARGVKFGRRPFPLPENFEEMKCLWQHGQISSAEAARQCRMPVSSFRYRARKAPGGTDSEKPAAKCTFLPV